MTREFIVVFINESENETIGYLIKSYEVTIQRLFTFHTALSSKDICALLESLGQTGHIVTKDESEFEFDAYTSKITINAKGELKNESYPERNLIVLDYMSGTAYVFRYKFEPSENSIAYFLSTKNISTKSFYYLLTQNDVEYEN